MLRVVITKCEGMGDENFLHFAYVYFLNYLQCIYDNLLKEKNLNILF